MELNAFIQRLLNEAKAQGMEPAEAYIVENESFSAEAMNGEITQYTANCTRGIGFRAVVDGKMGYCGTEALDEQAIQQLLRGARDSAELCENDSQPTIYPGDDASLPELPLYDPKQADVPSEDKLRFALEIERIAKAYDPRISSVGFSTVTTGEGSVRIVNTFGMDRKYRLSECGAYLQPVAKEGESTSSGYKQRFSRHFEELDANALASEAAQNAVCMLGAAPVASGKYRAVFNSEVMSDLLGVFSEAFSAQSAQEGMSLLNGRIGETIAAPSVTMIDNPLLPSELGSRPFDAEGVVSAMHTVVESGVFKTFLHNRQTALKDGVATTGNASKGGYAAPIRVSPTNFYLCAGKGDQASLLADMEEGLLITEVSGLHAGANAVSGDFSLLSKGFAVHNGRRAEPVEQITIAGNFFELLKNIRQIGGDLTFPSPGMGSPSVDVGEISVAGK